MYDELEQLNTHIKASRPQKDPIPKATPPQTRDDQSRRRTQSLSNRKRNRIDLGTTVGSLRQELGGCTMLRYHTAGDISANFR